MINVSVKMSKTMWPKKRPQKFYWIARHSNGKTMARSSEMYTNLDDCLEAVLTLFSSNATISLNDLSGKSSFSMSERAILRTVL